ncbi:MAG: glycosyl hydrolase 108 family protein [Cypionkella sp.]|nr:glycosyl hydrolase 108 family protein [Cypionkella sp.]
MLRWIGITEGGYANHPKDPGGPTDRGITQKTFDAWNQIKGLPKATVKGISRETADAIISAQYMDPVRFDDLPSGLDYAVADFSVNSGPRQAAKTLQKVLNVKADGIIGAITLAAIGRADLVQLIKDYCAARMAFLRGLKGWESFGAGWTRRVIGEKPGVQSGDMGVIDRAVRMAKNMPAQDPKPNDAGKATGGPSGAAIIAAIAKEPGPWLSAGAAAISAATDGQGPIQWALGFAIVAGILMIAYSMTKGRMNADD